MAARGWQAGSGFTASREPDRSETVDDAAAAPPIAVFDLDVTLTRYDTYLPFLIGYLRRHPRRWLFLGQLPIRLLAVWRWGDRDWIKESFLKSFVGGEPRARVAAWAAEFARRIHRRAMRPSGLQRLRWHQARGDRVILASASFDIYVEEIARLLDIDEVLATHVRWDGRERVAGIDGRNCRDDQKLARVRALLGEARDGAGVIAYSDSHADVPLLSWAETGVAVCPSRRLTHQIAGLGLEVQRW